VISVACLLLRFVEFSIKALGGMLEPAVIEVPADTRFKIEIENEVAIPSSSKAPSCT